MALVRAPAPGQGRHAGPTRVGRMDLNQCTQDFRSPCVRCIADRSPSPYLRWSVRPGWRAGRPRTGRPAVLLSTVPEMADLHALVAGFADVAVVYERGRPEYPPHV